MKTLKRICVIATCFLLTGCVVKPSSNGGESTRIVATSVATCEILDRLSVDGVVGIPETQSYEVPKRYEKAEKIGSPMAPNMEIVKSLEPTIILSPNSLEGELKPKYDAIQTESYFLNLKSVDGMYQSIQELGKRFGKEEEAKKLTDEFETYKANYLKETENKEAPNVLILMGLPGSYVVATESSYVGSLVKMAGATNVYGDGDGQDFVNVNTEDMLQKDPDIILRTSHAMPEQVKAMFSEEFKTNDVWKHFRAVQEEKVYDLNHKNFGMSATFRYPEALEELKPILFP